VYVYTCMRVHVFFLYEEGKGERKRERERERERESVYIFQRIFQRDMRCGKERNGDKTLGIEIKYKKKATER